MQPPQSPRFRPVLDHFAPYKPGKSPSTTAGRSFKLSSNESPFGPLPSVLKVIAEAAGDIHRYPDNGAVELTEAIATRYDVSASHVAVGQRRHLPGARGPFRPAGCRVERAGGSRPVRPWLSRSATPRCRGKGEGVSHRRVPDGHRHAGELCGGPAAFPGALHAGGGAGIDRGVLARKEVAARWIGSPTIYTTSPI